MGTMGKNAAAIAVVLCGAAISLGGIQGIAGAMTLLDPGPPDVSQNALESDETIFTFNEVQGLVLAEDVRVQITEPGLYLDDPELTFGTIPAGTQVNSHFIHMDDDDDTPGFTHLTGSVTFNEPVIGIIIYSGSLELTDSFLGLPGTNYGDRRGRGLEFRNADTDTIELSADRLTVTVDLFVDRARDQVRVLTLVPEPTSLLLVAAGLLIKTLRARLV